MIDGTLQAQRSLAAMESRHFEVDGLQVDQLLALCARLSRRLRYVDPNNQEAGTWQGLFEHDEAMVLASIASFGRYAWRQAFLKCCDSQPREKLAAEVLDLARRIDGWHRDLQHSTREPAVVLSDAIEQVVRRQLGGHLAHMVQAFDSGDGAGNPLRTGYGLLHDRLWPALGEPAPVADSPHTTRQALRGLGFSVYHATAHIQLLARHHLADSLGGGGHEPAAGLLLVFLRLYGQVQTQINGFSARHIDFYYRRVLGLQERAAQADRVLVACLPDPRSTGAVEIPPATLFSAGKDDEGRTIQFRAPQGLVVGDARVAALATLLRERDGHIAPEATMGYVTGVKAHWLGLPGADADAVPLLGGGPGSVDADLGLAVASPLLVLKEGERSIELALTLDWPETAALVPLAPPPGAGEAPKPYRALHALVETALRPPAGTSVLQAQQDPAVLRAQQDAFRRVLGQVFARWLLGDGTVLNGEHRRAMAERARELRVPLGDALGDDDRRGEPMPLWRMCSDEPDARRRVFHKVINDLFDVSLTKADGWLAVERTQFSLPQVGSRGGLQLRIGLRTEDPAVVACDPKVHGAQWPTRLPVLRLQVSARAGVHPCSLFETARFGGASLRVDVRGVRELLLHNQLGPLDARKPFAPFGPLPTTTSYLVVGSPEASLKSLDSLSLHLRWGGLPDEPGGWATHYAAYGEDQRMGRFAGALALRDGGLWWPCGGRSAAQPLFRTPARNEDPIPAEQSFQIDPISVREHAHGSSVPLEDTFNARSGVLRLQLAQPRGAFGHAVYPELLGQAVRPRGWRRGETAMPRSPYTPELESISLDYSAQTLISARRTAAAEDSERLLHIHPYGVCELQPDTEQRFQLLPALGADGNLFIGLRAEDLQGSLTLLFQLRPSAATAVDDEEPAERLQWAYLAQDRWLPLGPREVREDGTFGMLASGVVTLDLPEGARAARKDNQLFGGGLYWLRLSSASAIDTVSPLVSVQAQALPLRRVLSAPAAALRPLPAARVTAADSKVVGLAAVQQPEASVGLRPAEDARQLRTRAGERLRHKNRGSLVWDLERLVLEAFPEVYKVRCFSWTEVRLHHDHPEPGEDTDRLGNPAPGTVVVAVVPQVRRNDPASATLAPRLDSLALRRIKQLLAARVSPWLTLDVRNAYYERVQARCSLRLEPKALPGDVRRRVNTVITQYLSPWFDEGFGPRFDWTLPCDDVEAQVRQVPGVAEVAGLSLLHVTQGGTARYRLGDTAGPLQREGGSHKLSSRRPWGMALPLGDHLIEIGSDLKGVLPQAAGVDQLVIGQTFVIGRPADPALAISPEPA